MRKKDFETIAKGLQDFCMSEWRFDDPKYAKLCNRVADRLQNTQPKFDRQKFLTACGIEVQDVR